MIQAVFGWTLRFKRQLKLEETNTDGWYARIGTMGEGLPNLDVYLDRMNGGSERCFWFGFSSPKMTPIGKVKDKFLLNNNIRTVRDADLTTTKNGDFLLKTPLTKAESKLPVLEIYDHDDEYYFGIYDLLPQSINADKKINFAVEFFVPIIKILLSEKSEQIEPPQRGFFKRLIRDRQGHFRKIVLQAYDGACAITRCKVKECLEAAHLDRFADTNDNRVTNGVLLRADLHRLMDASLMTFLWTEAGVAIKINSSVKESQYRLLDGKLLNLPDDCSKWPSKINIKRHAAKA